MTQLATSTGTAPAFYNAGPVFISDTNAKQETLATYAQLQGSPAALVSIEIGKGRALLSACHIEYTPATLRAAHYHHRNASESWTNSVCARFEKEWTAQTDLWDRFVMPLLNQKTLKAAS